MARLGLQHLTRHPFLVVLLGLAALLVVARAFLPIAVTHYVNRVLNGIQGYEGRVADVDLHLWRGAYTVHDAELVLVAADGSRAPVFHAPRIDLSVEWRALWRGSLVGQIELDRPRINVYAGPATKDEQRKADDFVDRFRELLPMRINRFAVVNGRLHFQNLRADPAVDIYLDNANITAYNLTNSERISETLSATVSGEARAMYSGRLTLAMKLDPLAQRPTYELAFELKDLRLPELNSFLKHYLAVEARDGWVSLFGESKAKEGKFFGYVKPLVRDLDILRTKKEDKTIGETIKAFFVKIMAAIFENESKEQLATRIEFSGSFEDPQISVWEAVASFMRNAFISAIEPRLEGTVAPEQVKREQRRSGGDGRADGKGAANGGAGKGRP
jgi:hypothetical protein